MKTAAVRVRSFSGKRRSSVDTYQLDPATKTFDFEQGLEIPDGGCGPTSKVPSGAPGASSSGSADPRLQKLAANLTPGDMNALASLLGARLVAAPTAIPTKVASPA